MTSRESYIQAKESGLIGDCQMKVIDYLLEKGEAIQREVQLHYGNNVSRTYGTRFKELERAGVIQCVGTRLDEGTKRNVKLYRLLGVPTKRIGSEPKPVKVVVTKELAEAIIEMDNISFSEGLGATGLAGIAWENLLTIAEKVADRKADSTGYAESRT